MSPSDISQDQAGPQVIDRQNSEVFTEPVLGSRLLQLAYGTRLRPVVRTTLMRTGLLSRFLGWYTRTGLSRRGIRQTIDQLGIDETEFLEPTETYRSFHEFFVRRLKPECRPHETGAEFFSSPADARLTVVPKIDGGTAIPVKGCTFHIDALLGSEQSARYFDDGSALIFRLCPADYHRFHYPTSGNLRKQYDISGRYDSVNPISLSLGLPVFTENRRTVTMLDLDGFGNCSFVEVGAFGVGGITQTHEGGFFQKTEEKGFFHYGASTLVVVLEKDALRIDADLIFNSAEGIETLVRVGETIGRLHSRV